MEFIKQVRIANVSWRMKETGQNVCMIHALAVGYAYRGQGLGKIMG